MYTYYMKMIVIVTTLICTLFVILLIISDNVTWSGPSARVSVRAPGVFIESDTKLAKEFEGYFATCEQRKDVPQQFEGANNTFILDCPVSRLPPRAFQEVHIYKTDQNGDRDVQLKYIDSLITEAKRTGAYLTNEQYDNNTHIIRTHTAYGTSDKTDPSSASDGAMKYFAELYRYHFDDSGRLTLYLLRTFMDTEDSQEGLDLAHKTLKKYLSDQMVDELVRFRVEDMQKK